jgi:ketosteroid isomerase-like protein
MKRLGFVALCAFLAGLFAAGSSCATAETDRDAVLRTGDAIRAAFAAGDVAAAMRYHHPDVRKALTYQKTLVGRDAVAADMRNNFRRFHLEFVENHIESLFIDGDTAVEQTLFTIRGTPVGPGKPFLFSGRTMVVYVRYKQSPTGWASMRELIQPAD